MNAFNIREVQSLLKRRFFTDLINTNDHHLLLDKTMIGLRFKTNDLNTINPNTFLLYNYGIELGPKFRLGAYSNSLNTGTSISFNTSSLFFILIDYYPTSIIIRFFNTAALYLLYNLSIFCNFFLTFIDFYNEVVLVVMEASSIST